MTTLVLLGVGYLIALVCILAILTGAKRGDKTLKRQIASAHLERETPPSSASLGPIATAVGDELDAECVIVVVTVPGDPGVGVVRASLGAPALLGSRVPVNGVPATGALDPEEAATLGLLSDREGDLPWTFAHVPIAGAHDEVVGTVTVASRRSQPFADEDVRFIERVASRGASRFARRRERAPAVVSTR
jgi:hypothetical protein